MIDVTQLSDEAIRLMLYKARQNYTLSVDQLNYLLSNNYIETNRVLTPKAENFLIESRKRMIQKLHNEY